MPSIISYRKYTDALISRTLRLPEEATTHGPVGTELATLADGLTYVSLPDGAVLPLDQPDEIEASIQVVTLTPAQVLAIKAISPHVRLIKQRVRDKIAEQYSISDEIMLLRTAPSPEAAAYNDHAESCRLWGRSEIMKLGLLLVIALIALAAPVFAQTTLTLPAPCVGCIPPEIVQAIVARPHTPLKHWTHAVIASSVIAQMSDLSTTSWAMGQSGTTYREANPILRPFAGDPVALALAKGSLAVGLNYYLLRLHEQKPKTVLVLGIAQTLAVGWVAHRNAQVLGLR